MNLKLQLLFSLNFEQEIRCTKTLESLRFLNISLSKPVASQKSLLQWQPQYSFSQKIPQHDHAFYSQKHKPTFLNPFSLLYYFFTIWLLVSLKFWPKQSFAAKEDTVASKYMFLCMCPTRHIQGLCNCLDNTREGISVSHAPSVQKDTRSQSSTAPNPYEVPLVPCYLHGETLLLMDRSGHTSPEQLRISAVELKLMPVH